MGANCHYHQINRPVPVCCITDLNGKILYKNYIAKEQTSKWGEWAVSGATTMVTRFWQSSSASVFLVCNTPTLGPSGFPKAFGLSIEREVCIYMGYIDSLRPVTEEDLSDDSLLRVFVGIVENVKSTQSNTGGVTIEIQLRDRMKWLMDSMITLSVSDITLSADGSSTNGNHITVDGKGIARSDIIHLIAQRAVGNYGSKCSSCGMYITKSNNTIDIAYALATSGAIGKSTGESNGWYTKGGPLQASITNSGHNILEQPTISIHTTRAPIENNQESASQLSDNQVASEMVKYLALQEVFPTEFFVDHRDGNFYYAPRGCDYSGLTDEKRFKRTYYSLPNIEEYSKEKSETIDPNQLPLAFRTETSSIGLKTNFFIQSSTPAIEDSDKGGLMVHLKTVPYILRDLPAYACKNLKTYDPTAKSVEELALTALALARIYGKETSGATATLLGDPSLCPGEIVQVLGSPLLPQGGLGSKDSDRTKFLNWIQRYSELCGAYALIANGSETFTSNIPVYDGTHINPSGLQKLETDKLTTDGISSLVCSQLDQGLKFNEAPHTIYRVEAVQHKFNRGTKGFTTSIALLSPF